MHLLLITFHMGKFILSHQQITVTDIQQIIAENLAVELSPSCVAKIQACRTYLDEKVAQSDELIYGVNTGFGSLCNTAISKADLTQLQLNLVRSHACGTGDKVDPEVVRIMLLLKAIGLSFGHSGAQVATVERLLFYFNQGICPVVYEQGSLGASGDLAPLAHIALSLVGEGEVNYNGELVDTHEILQKFDLAPVVLASKEGLALLNGTQFMSAFLTKAVIDGERIIHHANKIGALSIEAYGGRLDPFTSHVNAIRNQEGQIAVAKEISTILAGSQLIEQSKQQVQDPYCLRCIPQVHGATKDTLQFVSQTLAVEINSVTDNPNVFVNDDEIISAGNFHGQPLALAMDYLGIAVAELANISERRTYQLISGQRGLPAFLVSEPGLNSGLMIAQYTSASIVSQNKQLATPASVDSIVSSNGQEDHVSMGANAATKCAKIMENVERVLAVELMTAAQALEFREKRQLGSFLSGLLETFRSHVPALTHDRILHDDMKASLNFIKNFQIDKDLLD